MKEIYTPVGGINLRLPPWHKDMMTRKQCVSLRNLRVNDEVIESILGTKKFQSTSLGSDPITALMPYYNDQTDDYALLIASGKTIYKKNEQTNEFDILRSGLSSNSIFSSAIRHGILYIASTKDGLKKYSGGAIIEDVGANDTAAGSFRQILYVKEVDRLFGISEDAIFGQISWCDASEPEIWDALNVDRLKLKDGEKVEGAEVLYGKIVIFCTYSVWIYYIQGNEENWKLEEAPTTIGCVAPNTIKKVGSEIWYFGESPKHQLGIYAFNGSTSRLLTDDISPLFDNVNKNKLRNACAELHSDLYTISWADGFSELNDISVDLDTLSNKEDGTPAIYGPHDIAFYSSAVLNNRQYSKQFLMGDQSDGFVYMEGGSTLKSINGIDGSLLQAQFKSMVHNEGSFDITKLYESIHIYFRPRSFFQPRLRLYFSYGNYAENLALDTTVLTQGDYNVYENRVLGSPELYHHIEFPGMRGQGTSLQIEIINDVLAQRLAIEGYNYKSKDLHVNHKAQIYAN